MDFGFAGVRDRHSRQCPPTPKPTNARTSRESVLAWFAYYGGRTGDLKLADRRRLKTPAGQAVQSVDRTRPCTRQRQRCLNGSLPVSSGLEKFRQGSTLLMQHHRCYSDATSCADLSKKQGLTGATGRRPIRAGDAPGDGVIAHLGCVSRARGGSQAFLPAVFASSGIAAPQAPCR